MNSNNKAVSASEFPVALFSLGLPILLAAYGMNGSAAPQNLAEILVAGLAVLGLLVEPYKNKQAPVFPLWLKAGIPCVLLFWAFSKIFTPLLFPLAPSLPFLMEIRPLLYGLVIVLWITNFSIPKPEHFYFWASWLAVLIICNFLYLFLLSGLTAPPNLFGNAELTGPILLAGLCSTLHEPSKLKTTRLLIFTGIMCTLSRDAGFAAVLVLLFFGPKGAIKKTILVLTLVLFNFLALASHEMTFFNPNDLPAYWLWFSILDLFEKTPSRLLTGHPLSVPLPLNIPASIWELWHKQNFAWTGSGTYIFHVTPIWLHILTAWGIAGIAGASAIATTLSIKYSSDTMASLITAVIITGFFSPLFYSPATGIVLIMAFICATRPPVRSFQFE
ncbi:hypothetical protein [Maridesulfovibrio ferrireducens]|uniref:hypothetical protein n=1 Tax=Maridesulfovibrio ferrireducens TaxID=246191 RepID=UPI001A255FC2|nr:hypothetical protein [Maridesulfovibrio ferrireducens]MBI9112043.1 hypothetical protein [Maridesulfovibrio ferrireducens]